ncbi:MAG: DUF6712 family protein [Paludibacter sp.]
MLINNLSDFLLSIPTAQGTEWAAIEPFVKAADRHTKSTLTGVDLYSFIEGIISDTNSLQDELRNIIAYKAYKSAIPFVDLIQTQNGFGVVSNANIAPASKERVERLIAQCDQQLDTATDMLILQISAVPAALAEWTKFGGFEELTNCIFQTGIDFCKYVKSDNLKRKTFLAAKNDLLFFQNSEIAEVISFDFMDELMNQIRTNTLTLPNSKIVRKLKPILGLLVLQKNEEAEKLLLYLANLLDYSLSSFTTYANSPEYAMKIAPKYLNKQTDSTFFFGM